MAFVVKFERDDTPKDCFRCPISVSVSSECVYCPSQGKHVHAKEEERPASCTIMECSSCIDPDSVRTEVE